MDVGAGDEDRRGVDLFERLQLIAVCNIISAEHKAAGGGRLRLK